MSKRYLCKKNDINHDGNVIVLYIILIHISVISDVTVAPTDSIVVCSRVSPSPWYGFWIYMRNSRR